MKRDQVETLIDSDVNKLQMANQILQRKADLFEKQCKK
jgi:hypothetical protein